MPKELLCSLRAVTTSLSKDHAVANDMHTCASAYQLSSLPKQLRNSLGVSVYLRSWGLLEKIWSLLDQIYDKDWLYFL